MCEDRGLLCYRMHYHIQILIERNVYLVGAITVDIEGTIVWNKTNIF
jgi:hypothetical protein